MRVAFWPLQETGPMVVGQPRLFGPGTEFLQLLTDGSTIEAALFPHAATRARRVWAGAGPGGGPPSSAPVQHRS